MADIVNNFEKCQMRVVPLSKEEFQLLANPCFINFLSAFGISKNGNEPILEGIQVVALTEFFEIDGIFAVKFGLELALLPEKLLAYILSK